MMFEAGIVEICGKFCENFGGIYVTYNISIYYMHITIQ